MQNGYNKGEQDDVKKRIKGFELAGSVSFRGSHGGSGDRRLHSGNHPWQRDRFKAFAADGKGTPQGGLEPADPFGRVGHG